MKLNADTLYIIATKILVIHPFYCTSLSAINRATTALKDFPLLAAKVAEQWQPSYASSRVLLIPLIRNRINQDIADIHARSFDARAIGFWRQKEQPNIYSVLTSIA